VSSKQEWGRLAATAHPDDIREKILTGFKAGKPFAPHTPTIALPPGLDRVLDFGCGLGRNFPYLTSIARSVTGFDLPPMIARCRTLATQPVDRLEDDWARLREERFDLIFVSLVLQHIENDACVSYLHDFARMAPLVDLCTRTDGDYGRNVLDLVAETGAYDCGPCIEVAHDPGANELRVVREVAFEDARRDTASRHYEVLLRSNVT
jgi:SAM-dependent methyltransferase